MPKSTLCEAPCPTCHAPCMKAWEHTISGSKHWCTNGHTWNV
jgi:hypothetical protein